ncbi:MAG TPA: AraC family transcriptional regulator [Pseudonocardia sp.]
MDKADDGRQACTADRALEELLGGLRWIVTAFEYDVLAQRAFRRFTEDEMRFHYAAAGSALVRQRDDGFELRAGDFVLLPRGGPSTLEAREPSAVYTGRLRLDVPAAEAIVRLMPEIVVACCFEHREPAVATLVAGMAQEGRAARAGSASLLTEIGNVVILAAIRSWAEDGRGMVCGWVAASRDPHLARVLDAIHRDPGSPWTVASLAQVAHSSRSQFAERFRAAVGDSPLHYLTEVRMRRAMELLADGLPSAHVGLALGYRSEAAFSRAFRRHAGLSPRGWRRERGQPA